MHQKNKQVYFKNNTQSINYTRIILLLAISLIFLMVGFWGAGRDRVSYFYQSDNTEIIVRDSDGENPDNQATSQQNLPEPLGPAKIEDIIGGTKASEFYQMPSVDKLLEGKEIEITK